MPFIHASGEGDEPRTIKEGDIVIVYERHDKMKDVVVNPKKTHFGNFGQFNMGDWVGQPFGSKVFAAKTNPNQQKRKGGGSGSAGFVYLLDPNADLWTAVLPHRTQILYAADISAIVTYLDLRPGSVVFESGTGSGSLTHSLIRAVAPTGHVHTFEFHEERCDKAREEFASHGLGDYVTCYHRNTEEEGFSTGGEDKKTEERIADAVFLDLPGPHKAIPHAAQVLRAGGMLCSFSPCIEQVQKSCLELESLGFQETKTIEVLLRYYDVRQDTLQTDLLAFERPYGKGGRGGGRGGGGRGRGRGQKRGREEAEEGGGEGGAGGGGEAEGGEEAKEAAPPPRRWTMPHMYPDTRGHTGYLTFSRAPVIPEGSDDEDE